MKFLFIVLAAAALEAGLAFVAVRFVEPIWGRGLILAVVPVALVLAVVLGDRE